MPSSPLPLEAARAIVLRAVEPVGAEEVALDAALDRVLAQEGVAAEPVPGFDNSAMDGFAIRSADSVAASAGSPASLRLVGESRAGAPAQVAVGQGETVRISTGAMLPEAADAVVRQEDATVEDGRVLLRQVVTPGRDVRRTGEDVPSAATVLRRGAALGPAELGILGSTGHATVLCARRPRVHVVTTGDELVPPDAPLPPGGVRNSNATAVPAQARRAGAAATVAARVPDDAEATRAAIAAGLEADVLVVCGGVSVGPHDHVKPALAELGVQERFWRVALRPGGPLWFGVAEGPDGRALVFGLPGNPVSAMVTFALLVGPALRALQGADPGPRRTTAVLDEDVDGASGRLSAVRCRLDPRDDGWHATPTGPQGSHVLTSMLGADALALIEPAGARAGTRVPIELLG